MITNVSLTKQFSVNEYTYYTDLDIEEDNQKIYHYCFMGAQRVDMSAAFDNHSPYSYITPDEFMCYLHDSGYYHFSEPVPW